MTTPVLLLISHLLSRFLYLPRGGSYMRLQVEEYQTGAPLWLPGYKKAARGGVGRA